MRAAVMPRRGKARVGLASSGAGTGRRMGGRLVAI